MLAETRRAADDLLDCLDGGDEEDDLAGTRQPVWRGEDVDPSLKHWLVPVEGGARDI